MEIKLIDPRASRRPVSAAEIAKICHELLADSSEKNGEIAALPARSRAEPNVVKSTSELASTVMSWFDQPMPPAR